MMHRLVFVQFCFYFCQFPLKLISNIYCVCLFNLIKCKPKFAMIYVYIKNETEKHKIQSLHKVYRLDAFEMKRRKRKSNGLNRLNTAGCYCYCLNTYKHIYIYICVFFLILNSIYRLIESS